MTGKKTSDGEKTLEGRGKKFLMGILESMHRIRAFEEKAGQMYGLRKIGGFCHLYNGQEAVAVGVISALWTFPRITS